MKSKSIVKILKLALKIPPSQDVFIPKCLPQIYLHCDGVALLGPELLSKYIGQSEAGVRGVFEKAKAEPR